MNYKLLENDIRMIGDIKLYRMIATKIFVNGDRQIKKGDLGGFVESCQNVSGNAWVSGNACVSGNARVSDNAHVSGNACVSGNAWVSGNAHVYGDAWGRSPLQIQGTRHFVNMCTRKLLKIGCYEYTISTWLEKYKEIGEQNNYSEQEIDEYGMYIRLAQRIAKLYKDKPGLRRRIRGWAGV